MAKRHVWIRDWGSFEERCKVCGATRMVWGFTHDAAYLNGKRQPYCPEKEQANE